MLVCATLPPRQFLDVAHALTSPLRSLPPRRATPDVAHAIRDEDAQGALSPLVRIALAWEWEETRFHVGLRDATITPIS